MSGILTLCGGAVLCALCALLLREIGFRSAGIFSCFCLLVIFSFLLPGAASLGSSVAQRASALGISEVTVPFLRVVGVGTLGSVCSEICSELGSQALGRAVGVGTRVLIGGLILPYLFEALDAAGRLLAG